MERNITKFKQGLFSLNTRRFGNIAELMIKEIYKYNDPENNAYDLLSDNNEKIEVKFSRVLKKCSKKITKKNAIKETYASILNNRFLTCDDAISSMFDCNIQQIKPKEFDILYYGCFFYDKILIFKIESERIMLDKDILYSNHQHRGNKGEGQFHINNRTISHHMKKYFVKSFTYDELYDLFI